MNKVFKHLLSIILRLGYIYVLLRLILKGQYLLALAFLAGDIILDSIMKKNKSTIEIEIQRESKKKSNE